MKKRETTMPGGFTNRATYVEMDDQIAGKVAELDKLLVRANQLQAELSAMHYKQKNFRKMQESMENITKKQGNLKSKRTKEQKRVGKKGVVEGNGGASSPLGSTTSASENLDIPATYECSEEAIREIEQRLRTITDQFVPIPPDLIGSGLTTGEAAERPDTEDEESSLDSSSSNSEESEDEEDDSAFESENGSEEEGEGESADKKNLFEPLDENDLPERARAEVYGNIFGVDGNDDIDADMLLPVKDQKRASRSGEDGIDIGKVPSLSEVPRRDESSVSLVVSPSAPSPARKTGSEARLGAGLLNTSVDGSPRPDSIAPKYMSPFDRTLTRRKTSLALTFDRSHVAEIHGTDSEEDSDSFADEEMPSGGGVLGEGIGVTMSEEEEEAEDGLLGLGEGGDGDDSEVEEGVGGVQMDDWNTRFQYAIDHLHASFVGVSMERQMDANLELLNLSQDFIYAAKTYGKIIISEVYVKPSKKTIKPISLGGQAGGDKYIANNILFKFALDSHGLFNGNDYAAAKVAGHELKGLMAYFSLHMKGIRVPIMALVDYRGFRLIAMSVLPVSGESLVYGSKDGGYVVQKSNKEFNRHMRAAGKKLNLKPHRCGIRKRHTKKLWAACDVEGHIGLDGQFYLLDFSRTLPPVQPEREHYNGHLYRLFRKEFVEQYKKGPLCSDAFSGFIINDPNYKEHNDEITCATDYLVTVMVPRACRRIVMSILEAEGQSKYGSAEVTEIMHRECLNMRYLGKVIESMPKDVFGEKIFVAGQVRVT